jgi:electron transfer flavoprotein beta subunit
VRIAVCLKRVPDTTSKIVVGGDGRSIDEAGLKFVPNPYDEYAIEEALKQKEASGSGETVVISCGGDSTQETIRTALAMGVDRGVLLRCGGSPDGLEIHQVGPMVADLLELPCVTSVAHLAITNGAVEAEREIEGGVEVATCTLPAVLTCEKGLNTPRLPSLKGIMAAKKKPLEVKDVTVGAGSLAVLGLSLPADRAPGRIVGEGPEAAPELARLLREEAKVI